MSKSYTKKAITIEAIQWKGDNFHEVMSFSVEENKDLNSQNKLTRVRLEDLINISEGESPPRKLIVSTLEGEMTASVNDYIIKGIKGEVYPCKPDIFEASYSIDEGEQDIGAYLFLGCSGEDEVAQLLHNDFSRIKQIVDKGNLCRIGIDLQSAPVSEVGIDGMQIEDIILVIVEIIKSFNSKYPCRENSIVITKLEEAHLWCLKRKMDREKRAVEGKNEK